MNEAGSNRVTEVIYHHLANPYDLITVSASGWSRLLHIIILGLSLQLY